MSYRIIGIEPTEISQNPTPEEMDRLAAIMDATLRRYGINHFYGVAVEYGASMYYDQPSNHPAHEPLRVALSEGWRRFRSGERPERKRA